MRRNTKKHLITRVRRLRQYTGTPYLLDMAYGKYRLMIERGDGQSEVSDRLAAGQMAIFLNGMDAAYSNNYKL